MIYGSIFEGNALVFLPLTALDTDKRMKFKHQTRSDPTGTPLLTRRKYWRSKHVVWTYFELRISLSVKQLSYHRSSLHVWVSPTRISTSFLQIGYNS